MQEQDGKGAGIMIGGSVDNNSKHAPFSKRPWTAAYHPLHRGTRQLADSTCNIAKTHTGIPIQGAPNIY